MIRMESVWAGYVPGIDILNDVTLEFSSKEITSIIGPNGAGKSTLLKTLYGFVTPHKGQVEYNGQDLTNVSPSEMLKDVGIAYIPQERSVFPELSVHENLQLGAWTIRHDSERTHEGIEAVYEEFPALKEKREVRARTLSGGQQRMLEIARSLITDPDVVLVDEPSAGLAPDLSRSVYRSIKQLQERGMTVILVDQNIKAAVDYGHELVVLENGSVNAHDRSDQMTDRVESLVSDWISAKGEVA